MNDSVKFPNTLDASVWASRCTAWFGAFKVPDLADWFAAALQCGYLQGVGEAEQKQGDREAAMRRFLALAPATREKFLEVAMAETPARTMTASQYLAWQQMNAAPTSPEAAPPRPEDPLQSFDARVWADEFMKRNNGLSEPFVSSHVQVDKDTMVGWFSNALMRGYDERRNVEAPFDEQRRQIEDSRRELVRDYRDLVARCMARIAELSEART